MGSPKLKIMVVDDLADNRTLLLDIFEGLYEVSCYSSGQQCLDAVLDDKPDLILLDVNMPGMDGYQVCEHLKKTPEASLIPVVFVSAMIQAEERLRGYEVGGDDYVTKPYVDEEIIEVVERVLAYTKQFKVYERQNKEAISTAFQAMTSSAELGQIIQYLQASYTYTSEEELATGLDEALQNFGLKCCINTRGGHGYKYFGCTSDSLEARVFERFCFGDRVLDFGSRTLVNGHNLSVLIKNMPLDNPENYGRIKDHLVVLMNGSEARLKVLESEKLLVEQRQSVIQTIIFKSHDELKEIRQLIGEQQRTVESVVETLRTKVEQIIFGLGLAEYQEKAIIDSLEEAVEGMLSLAELSDRVEKTFATFIEALDDLVE